jgi:hypothetical protein
MYTSLIIRLNTIILLDKALNEIYQERILDIRKHVDHFFLNIKRIINCIETPLLVRKPIKIQ